MRVTFKIDPTDREDDILRHDIQTWLQYHGTRDKWQISEEDDFEGMTELTVDFRDPLDEADFRLWRGSSRSEVLMRWREIGQPQAKLGDGTRTAKLNGQSNDAPTQQRPVRPTDVLKQMRDARAGRRTALMRSTT